MKFLKITIIGNTVMCLRYLLFFAIVMPLSLTMVSSSTMAKTSTTTQASNRLSPDTTIEKRTDTANDKKKVKTAAEKPKPVFEKTSVATNHDNESQLLTLIRRAQLLAIAGNIEQAITLLRTNIQKPDQQGTQDMSRSNLAMQYLLAELLISAGHPKMAASRLERALISYPHNTDLIILLAYAQTKISNMHEALNLLNNINPSSAQYLNYELLRGKIYLNLGLYTAAVEIYRQVVYKFPDVVQGRLGLAIALQGSGQLQEADTAYRQAMSRGLANKAVVDYVNGQLTALHNETRRQITQYSPHASN